MAYIPLPRREPSGFYDPNMAGPNWAQGIASLLGDLHKRREEKRSREKEEQERMLAERKQADTEAGTAAYAKDVETRRRQSEKPPEPGAAEKFFNAKHKIAQELFPNDPEKAYRYAIGTTQSMFGAQGEPKKTGGVMEWINKTDTKFYNEHKRLRTMGEKLHTTRNEKQEILDNLEKSSEGGMSEDPAIRKAYRNVQELNDLVVENDTAMKNLVQAIEYLPNLRNAYMQNGQVATSQLMQAITDISSSMEAIKSGGFFDQQRQEQPQPSMGGQPRQPQPPGEEMHPFIKRFLEENPDAMTDPALQQELAAIQAAIKQQR